MDAREVAGDARDTLALALNASWNSIGEIPFPLYQREAEALADAAISALRLMPAEAVRAILVSGEAEG